MRKISSGILVWLLLKSIMNMGLGVFLSVGDLLRRELFLIYIYTCYDTPSLNAHEDAAIEMYVTDR